MADRFRERATSTDYLGPDIQTLEESLSDQLGGFIESVGVDHVLLQNAANYSVAHEHKFYLEWLKDFKSVLWVEMIMNDSVDLIIISNSLLYKFQFIFKTKYNTNQKSISRSVPPTHVKQTLHHQKQDCITHASNWLWFLWLGPVKSNADPAGHQWLSNCTTP